MGTKFKYLLGKLSKNILRSGKIVYKDVDKDLFERERFYLLFLFFFESYNLVNGNNISVKIHFQISNFNISLED